MIYAGKRKDEKMAYENKKRLSFDAFFSYDSYSALCQDTGKGTGLSSYMAQKILNFFVL